MTAKLTDYEQGKAADIDSLLKPRLKLFKDFVVDTAVDEKQRRKAEIEREKAMKQEIAVNIEQKEKLEEILQQMSCKRWRRCSRKTQRRRKILKLIKIKASA